MAVDRKGFLKQGTAAFVALGVAGPFGGLSARAARGRVAYASGNGGYGALVPVPEVDSGTVYLHLPRGFEYRLLSKSGQTMTDGFKVPKKADGMAAFSWRGGNVRVIRNHENFFDPGAFGPLDKAYDARSGGGTTTLEVDRDRRVVASWTSLNGTNANCAGAPTPWDTWITCEETPNGPDANVSFLGFTMNLEEKHGYLFEVPASRGLGDLVEGQPIRSAGRFAHEAAAIDPATGIVYQTEDDFAYASGFFRYIPPTNPFAAKRVLDGGLLQVLGVVPDGAGGPVTMDLHENQVVGTTYRVAWIDIEDPDPDFPAGISNDDAAKVVFVEGESKGAARFSRLEGIAEFGRDIYFVSTQGGGPHPELAGRSGFGQGYGQVWKYDPRAETLTLIFESPGADVLDMPDNLTISPRRKSLLLCEDSADANLLRGLTPDGLVFDFALNAWNATGDEFAGATFSPDTRTLFVNLQGSGFTFAIWGPWEKGLL